MSEALQAVFASFHARECKYVVLGSIAAVLYGVPRATFDLDILIEASPDNAPMRRVTMRYRGQTFYVVSREDLIASKRAAGRPIDLEDVRLLEQSADPSKANRSQ